MGTLTQFLQSSFREHCPDGWTCKPEALVIDPRLEKWLGYSPRADVCLTSDDGCQRMWVEFEISRADPVANHVKFATSHLFEPLGTNDHFVSMVSSHVTRGRRNLASNTIHLLRRVGMSAFQTVLLPTIAPPEIKRLNHLPVAKICDARLDVPAEIARLFQVVQLSSNIIFIVAHAFLVLGVMVAYRQFQQSTHLRKKGKDQPVDIELKLEGMAMKGVNSAYLILLAALFFYLMYLKFVYPIVVVG